MDPNHPISGKKKITITNYLMIECCLDVAFLFEIIWELKVFSEVAILFMETPLYSQLSEWALTGEKKVIVQLMKNFVSGPSQMCI